MPDNRHILSDRLTNILDNKPWLGCILCIGCSTLTMVGFPVLWIAMAICALVYFRHSLSYSLIFIVCAIIPFILSGQVDYFSVGSVLLLLPICAVQNRYKSFSLTYEVCIIISLCVILALHLLVPDLQSWWIGQYMKTEEVLLKDGVFTKLQVQEIIKVLASVSTGLTALSMSINLFLVNFIATYIDALSKKQYGLFKEFMMMKMGLLSPILTVFLAVSLFYTPGWVVDLTAYVIGIMITYGFIVSLGVVWRFFKARAWVIISLFLFIFLLMTTNIFKLLMLLIAVTDYVAQWRTIFDSKDQPGQ